jgi:predicted enzyme related to lactoylglutathione lyase
MKNANNWFEIPVTDLDRATRFYEAALGVELRREDFFGSPMSFFPSERPGVGGALVSLPHMAPNPQGTLVYLNANGKLDACLDRIGAAGGAVIQPKTSIGQFGFIARIRDTENNVVGLHSEIVASAA